MKMATIYHILLQDQPMSKLALIFWLLFILFIYKLGFLERHNLTTDRQFTLYRDAEGLPHIFAKSYNDIFFGLGYAEAQDRLFGLFVKKMMVAGRLAELFGPDAVLSDLEMRNIGFSQMAKANLAVTDEETRRYLQAYADGINTYARSSKVLPLEYYLFWLQWEDWTVEDTLSQINFLSFNLEFDWLYEIGRQRLMETLGFNLGVKIITYGSQNLFRQVTILDDEQIRQAGRYKHYDGQKQNQILKQHWYNSNISLGKVHFPQFEHTVSGAGSNAWVISGNHTKNGRPLLANDPHVASLMPSLFYAHQVVLLDEENNVINRKFGAMPSGIPTVSICVGLQVAYGSTAAYIDNKDVYYETVRNNSGKMQYKFQDEWHDFKERKEVIKVRRGADLEETYYHTHRGVVIETIFMEMHWKFGYPLPEKYKNNHTISLSATHYKPDNSSARAFTQLVLAKTFDQFYQATKMLQHPNIDAAFITKDGEFGYNSVGAIPKRDVPQMGSFIKDGNTALYDIKGVLSDSEEPFFKNPKKGYYAMANNKFASDHFEFRCTLQETVTARAYRLEEIIRDRIKRDQKFSIQDMKDMQLDYKDAYLAEVMPKLIVKLEQYRSVWASQQLDKILGLLKKWDYILDKQSIEASFYQVLEHLFQRSLLTLAGLSEEELHAIINHGYFENYQFTLFQKIGNNQLTDEQRLVCESKETRKFKHMHACEASLVLAFKELQGELKKLFSSDNIEDYKWGTIHNQKFRMIPMSQVPLLNKIWSRSFPTGGNSRTLNVGIMTHQSKSYNNVGNPIFRLVTDLNQTYYSMDVGVTDRIFSPYYDNFLGKDKYVRYEPKNPFREQLPTGWVKEVDTRI